MSVLIKGMKMPKNCGECPLRHYDHNEDGFFCQLNKMRMINVEAPKRDKECPLAESREK